MTLLGSPAISTACAIPLIVPSALTNELRLEPELQTATEKPLGLGTVLRRGPLAETNLGSLSVKRATDCESAPGSTAPTLRSPLALADRHFKNTHGKRPNDQKVSDGRSNRWRRSA